MGCHALLQGIFPTQGWNSCLLCWQEDSLLQSHWEAHASVSSSGRLGSWEHLWYLSLECVLKLHEVIQTKCLEQGLLYRHSAFYIYLLHSTFWWLMLSSALSLSGWSLLYSLLCPQQLEKHLKMINYCVMHSINYCHLETGCFKFRILLPFGL